MEFRKVLFSPSKNHFSPLQTDSCRWGTVFFFMEANYFFQKHRQQRAADLSLLPHLFHNHARARGQLAAVGLSLALVSHRRNRTYTWYFVFYVYWFHDVYCNFKHAMRRTSYIVIMKKKGNYNFVFANHVFVLRTSDRVILLVDDDDDHNTSVVVVCRPPRNLKKGIW